MTLQRFLDAQHAVYAQALEELRAGRKRTHWMWFVFPQLAGLGPSTISGAIPIVVSKARWSGCFINPFNPYSRSAL